MKVCFSTKNRERCFATTWGAERWSQ